MELSPKGNTCIWPLEWLGFQTARWLIPRGSIPEPACPRQDAEWMSCHLCHSQRVKAFQVPPRSKGVGSCLYHCAEKHAGRRERWFHLPLEDIIRPYHRGNSSPGWPSIFLLSFYSPPLPCPPRQAPVSCMREAPPSSQAPSPLFKSPSEKRADGSSHFRTKALHRYF